MGNIIVHRKSLSHLGEVYGRYTIIECLPTPTQVRYRVACECGNESEVAGIASLKQGKIKSCGCLQKELASKRHRKHGFYKTPGFTSWHSMRARCYKNTDKYWRDYGGRGIKVCERWRNSITAFLDDMGPRPEKFTIDRKNNEGHYSCGKCAECIANAWDPNCHWISRLDQEKNKRTSVKITFNGETKIQSDWEKELGLRKGTIGDRLKRGWSISDALTKPILKR